MREIRRGKTEHTVCPTPWFFNLSPHIGMISEELAFADAGSYTEQWKSKFAEVMAWQIKPPNFRLAV